MNSEMAYCFTYRKSAQYKICKANCEYGNKYLYLFFFIFIFVILYTPTRIRTRQKGKHCVTS